MINVYFDEEGIRCAFYHNVLFGFIPVFIGAKSVSNNLFKDTVVNNLFKTILTIEPNITLHKGLLIDFLNDHYNEIEEKDCFDYFTQQGLIKGKELINKTFRI